MSIYKHADQVLLARYNAANGTALLPEHVKFVNPRPAALESLVLSKQYNTAVSMVMQPGAPFEGVATLYYNRIVLAAEFANSRLVDLNYIKIKKEETTRELVDYLNLKLGLSLKPEDIVDEPLNDQGSYTTVTIRVNNDSLEYVGSFVIGVMRNSNVLKKVVMQHDIDWDLLQQRRALTSSYPRTEAAVFPLNYAVDYSPIASILKRVRANMLYPFAVNMVPDELVIHNRAYSGLFQVAVNQIDGLGWINGGSIGEGPLNLNTSWAIYNGPTKDCFIPSYLSVYDIHSANTKVGTGWWAGVNKVDWNNPANLDYDNVLVLQLANPFRSSNRYRALVLFHYNEV